MSMLLVKILNLSALRRFILFTKVGRKMQGQHECICEAINFNLSLQSINVG
jgi:hypothetical protein